MNDFHIPFRKDRADKGGGLLLYIKQHDPWRELYFPSIKNIEVIFVEINLKEGEMVTHFVIITLTKGKYLTS